eukprot:CAMPEP_0117444180 /NCGR_PEP_ID=MMETSP0759-20121206/5099_1 /TAXON_ID=63605 /ORGANISM="Percolomonas cosmopolitus, Strain WS" /LENGTH=1257 /DNA_ID=CAMNT_0005236221 /DNA_START=195 /DNA_END=3968 /DNA_ORIENTATION=+
MVHAAHDQSQKNLLNGSPRTKKPKICTECHDDMGVYTFSNRKMYCKPCSSSAQCDLCRLELYTVISHDESGLLKTRFASDAPISKSTQDSFQQMNKFTTLFGHDELTVGVKPVFNFFQQIQQNPLHRRTKTLNVCMGCLKQHTAKTMSFMSKSRKPSKNIKKISLSLGTQGKLTELSVFENVLSFLPMPQALVDLMLVCQSWRAFFTDHTDFSWFNNMLLGSPKFHSNDPLYHISVTKMEEAAKAEQSSGKHSSRSNATTHSDDSNNQVWSDKSVLVFLKSLKKQCKNFSGFDNLRSITFDKASATQHISDYGFLCLCAAMKPDSQTLESVHFSKCPEITWLSMMTVAQKSKRFTSFKICGSEQLHIFKQLMHSPEHRASFETLEELHISHVDKLGLSILDTLDEFPHIQSLGFTHCTLYWDEKGLWNRLKTFPRVTALDLSDTDMPLRDSLVDLFQYFPNVEHLHCSYVQRANVADKVEMFRRCGPSFTDDISIALEFRVAAHEEDIIKKGEIGREMYFLTKGAVQVIGDNGKVLVTLKEGVFFGEIALLFDTPRTASVRALGRCHLFVLDQSSLFRVMRFHPESKDIIKEEAKRRWEDLQQQQQATSSLKEKKESKPEKSASVAKSDNISTTPRDNLPPLSKEGLLDVIRNMYNTKLKTLHIRAKGLALHLKPFLRNMVMLQTLFIEVETIKRHPPINLEMPSGDEELGALTTLRLDLTKSQYQISAEGWNGIGAAAPNLETLHIADPVTNQDLMNILEDCHRLRILDLPDSFGVSKAILHALGNHPLTEITTECEMKADSVIRTVSRNHPPLRLLNLQNVVFNESQLSRLLKICHTLQYVSVQTSTMSGVDPILFRSKFPQFAHITIKVNRNVTKTRRPGLSRASSVASIGSISKSPSKSQLGRIPSSSSLANSASPKRKRHHSVRPKKNSSSMVTTEADMKLVKEKLEELAEQKSTGRSNGSNSLRGSGRSKDSSGHLPHIPLQTNQSPLAEKDVHTSPVIDPHEGSPRSAIQIDTLTEKFTENDATLHNETAAHASSNTQPSSDTENVETKNVVDGIALPINTKSLSGATGMVAREESSSQMTTNDKRHEQEVDISAKTNPPDVVPNGKKDPLPNDGTAITLTAEANTDPVVVKSVSHSITNPSKTTKRSKDKRMRRRSVKRKVRETRAARVSESNGLFNTHSTSPYKHRPPTLAPIVQKSALLSDMRRKHFSEDMIPLPIVTSERLAPLKEELRRNSRVMRLRSKSPYSIM